MVTLILIKVKISNRLLIETVVHLARVHWEQEGPLFRNSTAPLLGALGMRGGGVFQWI